MRNKNSFVAKLNDCGSVHLIIVPNKTMSKKK